MLNEIEPELPEPGLFTTRVAVPARFTSDAGIATFRVDETTYVVVRSQYFQVTTAHSTKPDPETTRMRLPLPAAALDGATDTSPATGLALLHPGNTNGPRTKYSCPEPGVPFPKAPPLLVCQASPSRPHRTRSCPCAAPVNCSMPTKTY